MCKRSHFGTSFGSPRFNGSQSLLKPTRHHSYTIVPLSWDKFSCEKLLVVRFEILGLFPNKMTTGDKISRPNRDNLEQQIQMPLSHQPKAFPEFFSEFLKSTSNFQYFGKKEESHNLSITEIIDSERGCYLNV